jgi:hypothetical protein
MIRMSLRVRSVLNEIQGGVFLVILLRATKNLNSSFATIVLSISLGNEKWPRWPPHFGCCLRPAIPQLGSLGA